MKKLLATIAVQSISDIITNSSSEVFIARGRREKNQIICKLIENVAKGAKLNPEEIMDIYVAPCNGTIDTHKYRKGDLIIESTYDNSIPYWLREFIVSLDSNISRYFLG